MGGETVKIMGYRAVALGLLGSMLLVCAGGSRAYAFRNVKVGDPAPAVALPSTGGDTVDITSLQGKAVVMAFLRQGQEKSTRALEGLSKVAEAFQDRAAVVAVVLNPGDGDAAAWAESAGARFPILLDSNQDAYARFGVVVAPSTGVLDPAGVFVGEVDGHTHGFEGDVTALVKTALGEAPAEEAPETVEAPGKSAERKIAERHLQKARLLIKRKMTDKALAPAREAVQADDTFGEAHVLLGTLLLDVSDDNAAEALPHFERALEIDGRNQEASVGKARVQALQGDYEGAVAVLDAAVRVTPKPEQMYYELGRIHERAGQYEKAVEAYRKALEKLLH